MASSKIKLFVFDFDGTALGGHTPYKEFPRPFARFLDELKSKGIRWATDSTWHTDEQYELIKRSGVKSLPLFLSGQTSRLLATVRDGSLVHDKAYEEKVLRMNKRFTRKVVPMADKVLLELIGSGLVDRISFNSMGQNIFFYGCRRKRLDDRRTVWHIVRALLSSGEFYNYACVERPVSAYLLPFFFNKAEVLKLMQKRYGIKPEETVVAGDWTNDLHMLASDCTRWPVCPANAFPQVKRVVRKGRGVVAGKEFSWGVIEGVREVLKRTGQMK